jgi:hypothetical protein
VVDEVRMDEIVRELDVALCVDLLERTTDKPLVVLRRPYQVFDLT